jgi:hypothetical protein
MSVPWVYKSTDPGPMNLSLHTPCCEKSALKTLEAHVCARWPEHQKTSKTPAYVDVWGRGDEQAQNLDLRLQ